MSRLSSDLGLDTFVRERDDLIALAWSIVGHSDVAEDLVQESWLKWGSHRYPADRARPIFRTIVANLARDWHRRRGRESACLAAYELTRDQAPDTERVVIAREELLRVAEALKVLPDRTLLAFKLHRLHGMTYKQIAVRLDVCPARAYQLVTKALAHAAMELDRDETG